MSLRGLEAEAILAQSCVSQVSLGSPETVTKDKASIGLIAGDPSGRDRADASGDASVAAAVACGLERVEFIRIGVGRTRPTQSPIIWPPGSRSDKGLPRIS